ncbi:MAG TPA: Ig-like domain-containing protein [Gemmatimonadaceae bacterium]|nr:Ig-like domain-containing protein [Gemmatimonadaceae bacterium]
MRIRSWYALAACIAVVGAACTSALSPNSVCGGSIFLVVANGRASTLSVGDSLTLVAQQGVLGPGIGGSGCMIQNIPSSSVSWSTSDSSVVTVGPAGTAHALAPGTADVTATHGGLNASLALKVVQ